MADDKKIITQVLKGLGEIGKETAEQAVDATLKTTEGVITGKDWIGPAKVLSDQELAQKQAEDKRKSQEEAARLTAQMKEPGRNVSGEMQQVEQQAKQEERQQERAEADAREREAAAQEQQSAPVNMESANPAKRKKSRGEAFVQGKKKKSSAPDPSQMSATAEFSGKME